MNEEERKRKRLIENGKKERMRRKKFMPGMDMFLEEFEKEIERE
jgi:hypothetical protein